MQMMETSKVRVENVPPVKKGTFCNHAENKAEMM